MINLLAVEITQSPALLFQLVHMHFVFEIKSPDSLTCVRKVSTGFNSPRLSCHDLYASMWVLFSDSLGSLRSMLLPLLFRS